MLCDDLVKTDQSFPHEIKLPPGQSSARFFQLLPVGVLGGERGRANSGAGVEGGGNMQAQPIPTVSLAASVRIC